MKYLSTITFIAFSVVLLFSCNKHEESVYNTLTGGVWNIDQLENSGTESSTFYDGYTFDFKKSGTVRAVKGLNAVEGTWSVSQTDVLTMNFGTNQSFSNLTGTWTVKTRSKQTLNFEEYNDYSGHIDKLGIRKE